MNLILFEPAETTQPLPRRDARAVHILAVLRRRPGDTFDAGLINGPRGQGTLVTCDDIALTLQFNWDLNPPPPLDHLTVIVGMPRPQTARKILQEATSLGVAALHFVTTEKGEPSYAHSALWGSGEWRRHLLSGAEQAFCTRLPVVTHGERLADVIGRLPLEGSRLALDNYEAPLPLGQTPLAAQVNAVTLVLGSERGWSGAERELLRQHQFAFAHLGPRVLRTETACVAALSLLKFRRGLM